MSKWVYLLLLASCSLFAGAQETAVITDWIAMGSGCRGRASDLGDLRMNVQQDSKNPLRWEVNFNMGSYSLSGDKPIRSTNQSFARECSLRFAVKPPPLTRIKSVEAKTSLKVSKDKNVKAQIHSRLFSVQGSLVDWERVFDADTTVKDETIDMHLLPNAVGKKILSESICGAPKILGADFSFENHRTSFKDKVQIKHGASYGLNFIVYLENCKAADLKGK